MIIGEKVILEEIDPENIEQMRQWRNDPELRKYFREYKDITKPMQKEWYSERGNNSNPNHVYFQIMEYKDESNRVRKNPDGRVLIGCLGGHYIDWRLRNCEFGLYIGKKSSRGGGKGKEALLLLLKFLYEELGMHKVWCEVYSNNKAIELYKSIGFKYEGTHRHTQFCEGKYLNSDVLSMLEDEWFEKYGVKT